MKEQPSNPCEKVSFILTYDQLEAAYNIYREQFISCDFIRRSMERLEERIGLCNLPYETLRDDPRNGGCSLPGQQSLQIRRFNTPGLWLLPVFLNFRNRTFKRICGEIHSGIGIHSSKFTSSYRWHCHDF